jgi:hypothetical protein
MELKTKDIIQISPYILPVSLNKLKLIAKKENLRYGQVIDKLLSKININ